MSGPAPAAAAPASARLWRRLAAMTYDLVLLTGVVVMASALVTLPIGFALGRDAADAVFRAPAFRWPFFLYCLGVVAGFHLWFWTHGGQTLGMKTWRIRVERNDGGALSLRDAALRYGAALLSLLPLGLGFWWAAVDRGGLAWHDRLSGTRLVTVVPQPRHS